MTPNTDGSKEADTCMTQSNLIVWVINWSSSQGMIMEGAGLSSSVTRE